MLKYKFPFFMYKGKYINQKIEKYNKGSKPYKGQRQKNPLTLNTTNFWFVCKGPAFTSKFTAPLTMFKKFNLQPLDCLETIGCRGLTCVNDTLCKRFTIFSNSKFERDNSGCIRQVTYFLLWLIR